MSLFRFAWLAAALAAPLFAQADPGARVIVKLRADAAILSAQSGTQAAGSPSVSTVGRMQRLGQKMGLALTDGRQLAPRMHVALASGLSSAALVAKLSQQPDVEYVVADQLRFRQSVPNDPLFGNSPSLAAGQWYLYPPDADTPASINAVEAWNVTQGLPSVTVAVLDTGVRSDHRDFSGKFLPGYTMISDRIRAGNSSGRGPGAEDLGDWVTQQQIDANPVSFPPTQCKEELTSSWHGMEVAGVVGAATNNGEGIAGVGYNTTILPVRVLGKCGGYDSDIIAGMRWAAGLSVDGVSGEQAQPRARVLNVSLGSTGECSQAYQEAVDAVRARGVVVVASAGNGSRTVDTPANCRGVIAVGGLRHTGTKSGYSAAGPEVAISAPGGNCADDAGVNCFYPILSASNGGTQDPKYDAEGGSTYKAGLGTSFSAPMVSGTVALMLAARPALSPDAVLRILTRTARAFPTNGAVANTPVCRAPNLSADQYECYCTTSTCGAGMLDAAAAVTQAASDGVALIGVSPAQPLAGELMELSAAGSFPSAQATRIVRYEWQLVDGGGVVSALPGDLNAPTVSLRPAQAGQFVVRLTVTDDLNVSSSSTQTVTVKAVFQPKQGGGGGGGSMDVMVLLLGAGWVIWLWRRTSRPV
ncbi:S8 family serine peptidase [Aquabacterium sp.]|uniref:S8 family serine peptidase n=1 Tax=Aquabacterium sp. TaxID=1872578 RepID=UPI002E31A533|nr:S8 family serine peptidase [Aquabacterium sp.]HEX5310626.1 S8 family serine peptidase [Aquabacterium sp.]